MVTLCLDSDGGYCPATLTEPSDSNEQRYKLIDNGNNTYRIAPKRELSSPITMWQDTFQQGYKVYHVNYSGSPGQQWIFEEISDQIKSSMTYSSDGSQVATVTDARGKTVTNNYDSNNRLLTGVTDPNGNTTNYAYNPKNDQLQSVSKQVGGQTVSNSYQYEYDKLTSILHNGFQYSFVYDAFGNTIETKVGTQTLSSNTYLANNGLLDTTTYGNGDTVKFHYDKYGREVQRDYNGNASFRYQFDSYGNPLRHEDLVNGVNYRYNYDTINRLVGMDATNGQELRVHYDDKNRVDYNISKVNGQSVKTTYQYGDTANPAQKPGLIYGVKINDQDTVSYTYDELARIKERTLNLTSPFKTSFEYTQGPSSGTTTAIVERIQNGNDILSYTYDNIGNIETISENGELKATYHYDELNQLIREDNLYLNKSISYSYDTGGNILSVSEYAYTTGELGEVAAVKTYGYEDANWKDKLTSYNGQTITYDEIGNPTYYYNDLSLYWENGRQLSGGGTGAAGGSFSYDYNDAGLRVRKSGGFGTIDFYYNGDQLLSQVSDTGIQMDFLYDDAESLIGFLYNGTAYYYVRNLQNDIIGILDSDGNQVVSYVYDSWGKLISTSGSLADTIGFQNPFRYRGYYYDQETGFYYLQSRYYDPETGRFLNSDALLDVTGTLNSNLYAYCGNNPINREDVHGYLWNKIKSWFKGVAKSIGDAFNNMVGVQTITSTTISDKKSYQVNTLLFNVESGTKTTYTKTVGNSKPINFYVNSSSKKTGFKIMTGKKDTYGMGISPKGLGITMTSKIKDKTISIQTNDIVALGEISFSVYETTNNITTESYFNISINKFNLALLVLAPYCLPEMLNNLGGQGLNLQPA